MTALPGTRGRRRIFLLRHGDVNYFTEDGERVPDPTQVKLTEWGREQAAM
ncbi:MAG: histidine phosphatase family protein, partial [Rhodospirillales bacterium]|nr:histidine phosphatase family protein [Rhodospirillales bacterium]